MSPIAAPVGEGTRVVVNFSLSLEDGSEVDAGPGVGVALPPVQRAEEAGAPLPGREFDFSAEARAGNLSDQGDAG